MTTESALGMHANQTYIEEAQTEHSDRTEVIKSNHLTRTKSRNVYRNFDTVESATAADDDVFGN